MKLCLLFLCLPLLLTGCIYKMPTNESVCTLPNMGNPQVTREKPSSIIPGK